MGIIHPGEEKAEGPSCDREGKRVTSVLADAIKRVSGLWFSITPGDTRAIGTDAVREGMEARQEEELPVYWR